MALFKLTYGTGFFRINDLQIPRGRFVVDPLPGSDFIKIICIENGDFSTTGKWTDFVDKNGNPYPSKEILISSLDAAFKVSDGQNSKDAFGLLETASPQVDFDAQLTYDDQPLLYEQIPDTGLITYDGTDGVLNISNNSLAGEPHIQTYRYFPYRPGLGKKVFITFNFEGPVVDNVKYAQFGDENNAIGLRLLADGTMEGYITTETSQGNQVSEPVNIAGLNIDVASEQIMVIQYEALYVGSVQIGLQLGGTVVWVAVFDNANTTNRPYIRTANLPVRVGIISTGTTPASMVFNCCSVQNSGGADAVTGFDFSTFASITAGNDTPTHAISLRPKLLFKTRVNRVDFINFTVEIAVRGNNSVRWKLVIGQALTAPTYSDVNTDYSAMEFETDGTLSGTPAIVLDSGTILATAQSKSGELKQIPFKYPITLDAAGAHRDLGTLTLIVEGVGGVSDCDVYINHREVR